MNCPFCKTELTMGATVCNACGAQQTTRAQAQAANTATSTGLVMMSIWLGSVGFIWLMTFWIALAPLHAVHYKGAAFFTDQTWRCIHYIDMWNVSTPKSRFTLTSRTVDLEPSTLFSAKGFFGPVSKLPDLGASNKECPKDLLKQDAEQVFAKSIEQARSRGFTLAGAVRPAPEVYQLNPPHKVLRNSEWHELLPVDWRDYTFASVWALVVFAVGIPLALCAGWLWRKVFGDPSQRVWVRRSAT